MEGQDWEQGASYAAELRGCWWQGQRGGTGATGTAVLESCARGRRKMKGTRWRSEAGPVSCASLWPSTTTVPGTEQRSKQVLAKPKENWSWKTAGAEAVRFGDKEERAGRKVC